jgi:hypothetical protein
MLAAVVVAHKVVRRGLVVLVAVVTVAWLLWAVLVLLI